MDVDAHVDVDRIRHHWLARCVENGVPLQDYRDITDGIDAWSQWCGAWNAVADERIRDAQSAEANGAHLTAAQLRVIASIEYHFGKFLYVHAMDMLRETHVKSVTAYREAMPALPWPGQAFDVQLGDAVFPGVLRLPGGDGPHPVVVLVPGLDATKEELHTFQDVFLARGLATVSFDGPGQGESEYDHPLRPDWEVVGTAAVDAIKAHSDLDCDRIGLVGLSLGGYYAARAAAGEPRLRCAVSVGGCENFGAVWDRLPFLTRLAFTVRSRSGSDAETKDYALEFNARAIDPSGGVPFLVVHGEQDPLFDTMQAELMATHFGDEGQLWLEPRGNHVLHNLAYRVRPAVADWVASHLDRS